MIFAERLKSTRIEKGYTQKKLCDDIGISAVTMGNWERGMNYPSLPMLVTLSKELDVSLDYLVGIDDVHQISTVEKLLLNRYRALDEFGKKAVDSLCKIEFDRISSTKKKEKPVIQIHSAKQERTQRYIPYYMTPSAAGCAVPLDGSEFEMLLADDSVPKDADYAVRIQGDSMLPYIEDGQLVFVKKDRAPAVGDVGIFCVDGSMYCKQYYRDENGYVHLLSANPKRASASIHLGDDCDSTVTSCGTVIMKSIPLPKYISE